MTVVCNSSPLIAFLSIDRIDIIRQLFNTVIIPEAVYEEVFLKINKSGTAPDFIKVEKANDRHLVKLLELQIDHGESEVISLAVEKGFQKVILDDKQARQTAERMGLKVIGVVGILMLAKEKKIIVEIKPLILKIMEKINFRLDRNLLNKILNTINETPV